jgi:hypothetical protein
LADISTVDPAAKAINELRWTPRSRTSSKASTSPPTVKAAVARFETAPRTQLEKVPVEFRYQFRCAETTCNGHRITCTDWEMGQSYRDWPRKYGDRWENMFRQRYEREMIEKNDTHFFVGNIHQHPDNWFIVGLFYPPKPTIGDLFDAR